MCASSSVPKARSRRMNQVLGALNSHVSALYDDASVTAIVRRKRMELKRMAMQLAVMRRIDDPEAMQQMLSQKVVTPTDDDMDAAYCLVYHFISNAIFLCQRLGYIHEAADSVAIKMTRKQELLASMPNTFTRAMYVAAGQQLGFSYNVLCRHLRVYQSTRMIRRVNGKSKGVFKKSNMLKLQLRVKK